jgi:SdrD B-like domain
MKARAARALSWAACLCGLGVMAATGPPVRAQSAPAPAAAAAAYEDRLINGGNLTPDISSGDYLGTSDPTGLARSIRVDAVASVLSQQGQNAAPTVHENGIVLDTQWETSSYGAWSADAGLRVSSDDQRLAGSGDSRDSFSVHERGMPFDDGWQADNALGDLNAPLINLARTQPRFLLSSGTMLGATTEWRGPDGLQIVAGGGEPGVFDGIKVPTFDTLGGSTATLGAEWSPAPHWSIGGEYAGARDANIYYQPLDSTLLPQDVSNQRISSSTGLLSAAWQEGGTRAQVNLIDGTLDGNNNAFGIWADASHTHGAFTQTFGIFRIDPNLAWGNQLITSDVEGGYYRVGYQTRRWTADFGIDEVVSVTGNGANSTFLNGDARYQLSRDMGIGGVANVLLGSDGGHNTSWSLEGYLDEVNGYGSGRLQLDYATDPQTQDATVTVQQSWATRPGTRLATSVAVDRVESTAVLGEPQLDSTIVRLSAYGGGDLTARLSLDGSVQWASAVQGRAAPSTSADVSLTYQIARSWGVLFSFYENRVGSWTPLVVSSPLTPPTPTPQASLGQRGFFLTLRYQAARGGHFIPLGGAVGSGSGRLSGVVYLDANENGRFDAGENGAPNVTVILDGRFSVRTDSSGRFDFAAVVAGHHVITVQPDNLPLPWTLTNSGRTEVDVGTRDRTEVAIGATRVK